MATRVCVVVRLFDVHLCDGSFDDAVIGIYYRLL